MKNFPIPSKKILPVALVAAIGPLSLLIGCHSSNASVEASTKQEPVVAPAGTVLRVRLNQGLETGRSRAGDRFSGVLDSSVKAGGVEILPKGTAVEGRVLDARESNQREGRAVLAVVLNACERDGRKVPVETTVLTWTSSRHGKPSGTLKGSGSVTGKEKVSVPAETVIGFTLKSKLNA